jgi:hypothetical protein
MLDCEGVVEGITYPARRGRARRGIGGEEVYARVRDGRRICLVELAEAVGMNEEGSNEEREVGRTSAL